MRPTVPTFIHPHIYVCVYNRLTHLPFPNPKSTPKTRQAQSREQEAEAGIQLKKAEQATLHREARLLTYMCVLGVIYIYIYIYTCTLSFCLRIHPPPINLSSTPTHTSLDVYNQVGKAEKEQAKRRQKLEALAPEKIKEEQAIKVRVYT
jgi:hypothetical protein